MPEQDVSGVTTLINSYLDAYNAKDIEALGGVLIKDESLVAYGTDEGETWHGWKDFQHVTEKLFEGVQEIRWKRGTPKINFSADGGVAWFSEELSGHFMSIGDEHDCPIRFTGVAERIDGQWTIVQFHRSVAVEGYSVPYLESHGVRFD